MGANCSSSCFGSAMEAEASKVASQSESLWPRFKRRIKQKSKNQSSKAGDFSNYGVDISPTCPNSAKSRPLVRIVSISPDGEFVPIILLPVGKSISRDRQATKKEKSLGFDAVEMKVKSRDPKILVNSRKLEVCTQQKDEASAKKSDNRSWFRITKAFKFAKTLAFHSNGRKVSQNPIQRSHSKDSKTPVIEQPKAQESRQKKEVADSIPGPIENLSKSSGTSAAVDCKSNKLWKFINFHRKVSSHGTRRQGIKSATLSQLPRRGMNSNAPNFQPKKIKMSAERKGTIMGDTTSEGEGYSMAIYLSILIIIMACLVVLSNRVLAVLCTSIWWYLLPSLMKKYRLLACINSGRLDVKPISQRKYKENACIVTGA
eukprot:PITA_06830